MIEAARKTAWATDKGMTIANCVVTALRDARILLPSISTIERASIAGRARARKQAAYALIADLRVEPVHTLYRPFADAHGPSQDRKRVCQGKKVSVRFDLWGRRTIDKTTK